MTLQIVPLSKLPETPSDARVIAELQALRIGLALVDGDISKLPEIMTANRANPPSQGSLTND